MMNNSMLLRKSMTNMLLVQWSRFGAVPIKINGSTLFTGTNGSGKSTILDALTYVLTGNTQFNKAAQDRDRSVLSYVRGDTKSKGQYQYLRNGNVISYIAVEFFSTADNFYITVGVCIESTDEMSWKSFWFVKPKSRISDFNFYKKVNGSLFVTPKNELKINGSRLKSTDFLIKSTGINTLQRALGLRGEPEILRRKLIKMMAFQPENNIDKFIRDSVLPEKEIQTLAHLKEQKQQFAKIKDTYTNILNIQTQLNKIEERAIDYEKAERSIILKRAELKYQNFILAEKKQQETQKVLQEEKERLTRLEKEYIEADTAFNIALQHRTDAEMMYNQSDFSAGVEQLENAVRQYETEITVAKNNVNAIIQLQKSFESFLDDFNLPQSEITILNQLCDSQYQAEEKYHALKRLENTTKEKIDLLKKQEWDDDKSINEIDKAIINVSQSIKKLENNISDYPKYVTDAITEINSELSLQGITAKVRTFAELVESISDPQWRNALEVYLRNNKFNLIIDSQYTGKALEIFHRKKYYKLNLVLTDKLENYEACPGSAAKILNIPNKEARLYANYLLGRLHLCATLDELHNHPKGGIMADGTLAKGLTASNLDFANMEYYLGRDSIKLQLEQKQNELKKLNSEKQNYVKSKDLNLLQRKKYEVLRLSGNDYRFESVNSLPKLIEKYSTDKAELTEMQNNPNFLMLQEQRNKAINEFNAADKRRTDLSDLKNACNREIKKITDDNIKFTQAANDNRRDFDNFIIMHLELKKEAISEYERLSRNNADGIAVAESTIEKYEGERKNAQKKLEDEQIKYCNLSGRNTEERGISYISVYRAERDKISNVDAEETRNKLEEKQQELESAFVTDFIAAICESLNNAKTDINAINDELEQLPFGQDVYSFKANEKKDRAAFFRIKHKLFDDAFQLNDFIVQKIDEDPELHQDIMDFLDTILKEADDDEYTDYRTYYSYDMQIKNQIQSANIIMDLSEKQGSASNGEKQTPYFIILAASLMTCYKRTYNCARLAFIDEAFSALSQERIEQMVNYFEQNGFQVMYAAPPEKINSIGKFIDSTISLVETGRYTNVLEGLADEFIK